MTRRGASQPLVPLLMVVVVGLAGGGFLFMNQQQEMSRLKASLSKAQQDLTKMRGENQQLTEELGSLRDERQGLEERISSLGEQLSGAATELERSRLGLEEMKGRYEQLAGEREKLQALVSTVTDERDEVRKRAEAMEQAKKELERSVARLRERLALLDHDYQKLAGQLEELRAAPVQGVQIVGSAERSTRTAAAEADGTAVAGAPIAQATVELPPIIVRKDQAGMSVPLRGRIIDVNQPHNFIVVDKGSADGVRVGMAFDLLRGANTVGRATVVRVRPQLAACDIVRTKTPGPLQSGDLAVQSGP